MSETKPILLSLDAAGKFYDFNVHLEKNLYSDSLNIASFPLYQEAARSAFSKGSDGYSELEILASDLLESIVS